MPRFYFHVEDGTFQRDEVGRELTSEAEARVEAVRASGDHLSGRPQELWESQRWRMLVTTDVGPALFGIEVVPVSGAELVPWRR